MEAWVARILTAHPLRKTRKTRMFW